MVLMVGLLIVLEWVNKVKGVRCIGLVLVANFVGFSYLAVRRCTPELGLLVMGLRCGYVSLLGLVCFQI